MTLDVPAEYEEIIRQAVASGAFSSPEEAVRHALELLQHEQKKADAHRAKTEMLPEDLDPNAVARDQGVGPIQDPDAGSAETWPADEIIEHWLADLQILRGHGTPRQIP